MQLRPYQDELDQDIDQAYENGADNVLAISPTGSGKTVLFSHRIKKHDGPSCAIAHRQELVSQISLALNRDEIHHRIIGPDKVVKLCVGVHMEDSGRSYYRSNAHCAVAGVDTLVRRSASLGSWLKTVTQWVQDEAHHVLEANKWGTASAMFPNARGLGVTATPERADGRGLGRWADGLFDEMVEGRNMRDLINMGYLTDYRVFAPKTEDLYLENVKTGSDGDYTRESLKDAVRQSHVVGDVVKHYLRIAPGKLGVTFATDVETATDIANQFNLAGVPAAVVSAKTPDHERISILRDFKARKILQLVNVDLFGEGFDLPAIEVVSMARPTKSYSLFVQQFGRALRLMLSEILAGAWDTYTDAQRRAFIAESTKPYAIIIDHVGNIDPAVGGHGLPDAPHIWSLDAREKRSAGGKQEKPTKVCIECTAFWEGYSTTCPCCGHIAVPGRRDGPEFVDGDLLELDAETLAAMRGEVEAVDMTEAEAWQDAVNRYIPSYGIPRHVKRHLARQDIQGGLRASIGWWAAYQREANISDSEAYRRFYYKFKIDVLSAQALNTREANTLAEKINEHLAELATV